MFDQIEALPMDDAANRDQRFFIYALVKGMKPKVAVEVGTHRGVTALTIAQALFENESGHLHTYDPIEWGQQGNIDKFPHLQDYITFYKEGAETSKVTNIDFLFIDGFHEYEVVKREIEYFFPKLTPEAVVLFHDAGGDNKFVGVNQAIDETGMEAVFIPMSGKMRLYCNLKNICQPQN